MKRGNVEITFNLLDFLKVESGDLMSGNEVVVWFVSFSSGVLVSPAHSTGAPNADGTSLTVYTMTHKN